jgi:hypothetical protein
VLAGDFDLVTLLSDLSITGLQFFEQPHVLDGDNRLVGKGLEKLDLGFRECARLRAVDYDCADRFAFADRRYGEHGAKVERPRRVWKAELGI